MESKSNSGYYTEDTKKKKNEKNKIEKFRPINKLRIYEKKLEIIVRDRLVECTENNNLLKECQSGVLE